MALRPCGLPPQPWLILLFTLLPFSLASHAKLTLDPSDFTALSTVTKHLGAVAHHQLLTNPCGVAGVVCERRLSVSNTFVLRVTGLVFKSQHLYGSLSPAIGRLSELKELSLPHNNIVDRLPSQIVNCKKLEILDLRSNQFSGEVPENFSSLIRLRVLDLSSNLFSGKLPPSIRSFPNLQFFDFSGNSLLEDPVPPTNGAEASSQKSRRYILAEKSAGNGTAARAPASSKPSTEAQAPSPSKPIQKHKNTRKKMIGLVLGFLVGAIAGSISGFIFSLMFKLILAAVRGRKLSGPSIYSPLIKKAEDLAFLEKDGLASLELIGKGGCGEVYKAELPGSEGKLIAIKKIIQPPKDAAELTQEDSKSLNNKMRQIQSEIKTVGQIRHRNLLPLLAHVPRPNCHYLVYEFMKNGSLQDMLNQVSEGTRELDWLARHRIAVGVAAGLEYLHMNHIPHIIHRDLKPANILLDDDMEARIADFGLAKAMPDAHTHITASNVAGTVGYIAPEYHQTLKFTDKCDIYSFGIVLAVLVTGRLPSDEFFQHTEEMSLVKWLRNIISSENPSQAIDFKLAGTGYEEQMLLVLKIACFCTWNNPRERPDSKEVRCMLNQINH